MFKPQLASFFFASWYLGVFPRLLQAFIPSMDPWRGDLDQFYSISQILYYITKGRIHRFLPSASTNFILLPLHVMEAFSATFRIPLLHAGKHVQERKIVLFENITSAAPWNHNYLLSDPRNLLVRGDDEERCLGPISRKCFGRLAVPASNLLRCCIRI